MVAKDRAGKYDRCEHTLGYVARDRCVQWPAIGVAEPAVLLQPAARRAFYAEWDGVEDRQFSDASPLFNDQKGLTTGGEKEAADSRS
ncbi:hypothetical protein NDU88_003131 [Pleurodeles waltl]|uniref:Uncharacterized protein n=1 Tax=Pleurodeles waltl TaxID=8319 RepID=A0AAV7PBU6_PLEWA|nr:hypothetical protein NDU88_003131 [Pleurodeles waltl]